MPPLRSCSHSEKPPWLPRPGIDGGMIANAAASGTVRAQFAVQPVDDRARLQLRRVRARPTASAARSRSALLLAVTRVSRLKPTMVLKLATPSVCLQQRRRPCAPPHRCARATPPAAAGCSAGSSRSPLPAGSCVGRRAPSTPAAAVNSSSMRDADQRLADQAVAHADVAVASPFSSQRLNASKKRPSRPRALLARPQQHRRQRRRQRQRVERRDHHRDRDRDGELLIQPALDAAHQADRDEHRGENQRDADRPAPTLPPSPCSVASFGLMPSSM